MKNKTMLQAHRGVSTDFPENTMSAFEAAVEQGYDYIELDPAVTSDGQIVVLHDETLDRTAMCDDGSAPTQGIKISDITYADALRYDVGLWFGTEHKGQRIPLLSDVMQFAKNAGIPLKIDNKIAHFDCKYRSEIIRMAKEYGNVGITCYDMDEVRYTLGIYPDAQIHYDGAVDDGVLDELAQLVPEERLVVWLPYKCDLTWWVQVAYADEELCTRVKQIAKLGIWIIEADEHFADAVARFQPDIVETTGSVKPIVCS